MTEATDREGRNVANLLMGELNSEKNFQLIQAGSGLDYETMDSYIINMQGASIMVRAEIFLKIFLKIFLSVKLEIFRLDREAGVDPIIGDAMDLIFRSCSHTYPGEVMITVTDINDNSSQFATFSPRHQAEAPGPSSTPP